MTAAPKSSPARGDFIKEAGSPGLVFTCGAKSFDVIWMGGSTSRYRHGTRNIDIAKPDEISKFEREHLTREAAEALDERKRGDRRKRGQIWPSR